jgi:nicotinamidase-related amidase
MANDTALLVIDVQKGMFAEEDPVYQGQQLLETLNRLIGRARAAGTPVIYVRHNAGSVRDPLHPDNPGWPIHPAIAPAAGETVVDKREPDSFYQTTLQQELEDRGIKKLIIAGLQTDLCVDTTCRRAYSLGYEITLVSDAHSTWNAGGLSAAQIIAHHNQMLGGWFVTAKPASQVEF